MDDSVKITQDADVLIAVLANDFDPDGDPLTVLLISDPENGTATVNGAGNVQYDPNPGFSGIDSFQYQICDPFGLCDTAWIIVCVAGDFFVPDVITPNGDGDNDFFVITGIENYPNNTLTIFNRWGDRVWSAGGYVNQWRGTYDDNGDLPDGTYYFILDLGDGSQPITGFVAVFR
jgi:gliding motility-associated-like protein